MNAFTLFGIIQADTKSFKNSLLDAERQLDQTEQAITQTERKARELGQTSATTARGFEKLREKVQSSRESLEQSRVAFERGNLSAKQMARSLDSVSRSAETAGSKVKDLQARLSNAVGQELTQRIAQIKSANAQIATDEAAFASNQRARFAAQQKGLSAAFAEHSAQIQQGAKQNAKVLTFAQNEIATAQARINKVFADQKYTDASRNIRQVASSLEEVAKPVSRLPQQLQNFGSGLRNVGTSLAVGLTAPLIAAGYAFVNSATSIDAMRNKLISATGSIESANAKMKELRTLAQSSAGVFTAGAVEMYAFLKPMQLGEGVIDNMIQAMGRLKLANESIDLNKTALNLTQLFTQGFERTDLKEMVGAFPRFGEIMKAAFNLSDSDLSTVAKEMKEKLAAGLSKEDFFGAIADAINKDASLSKLTDTVGIRFQKMMERIFVAIEPLGNTLLSVLEPLLAQITPIIERLGTAFAAMSEPVKIAVVAVLGFAAALGPLLIGVGAIVSAVGAIAGAVAALGGLTIVVPVLAALGIMLAQLAAGAALLYTAWQTNFGGIRDLVGTVAEGIKSAWSGMSAELLTLTSDVTTQINAFWAENGADILQALRTVSNGIKSIWQSVMSFWTKNHGDIVIIAKGAWTAVRTLILGAVGTISSAIKLIAAVINGDWSKVWASLGDIVKIQLQVIVGIFKGLTLIMVGAVKVAFNAVWALSAWVTQKAAELGTSVVNGIVNGIKSGVGRVAAAGIALAKSAIDAMKGPEGVDSQSPSKVFFKIGTDVAQGFIDGMESMKTGVSRGMAKMLDISSLKIPFGKGDTAGVELLTSLVKELDDLTERTKLEGVMAELAAGKYAKLNAQIKDRIILAAKQLDFLERMKTSRDVLGEGSGGGGQDSGRVTGEGQDSGGLTGLNAEELKAAYEKMIDIGVAALPAYRSWNTFWSMMQLQMAKWKQSLPSMKQAIGENLLSSIERIGDVFGNAISQWDGTAKGFFRSLAQGFRQLIQQIVAELVRLMVVKAVLRLVGSLVGGVSGGGATAGAHGDAGFAEGGAVRGAGSGTSDSILARLSNGEFVMSAKAVKAYGANFFEGLNRGFSPMMPAFASGGLVGSSSSVTSIAPTININIQGGSGNAGQTADQVQRAVMNALNRYQQKNK